MRRVIGTIALVGALLGATLLIVCSSAWAADKCTRVSYKGICLADAAHAPEPAVPTPRGVKGGPPRSSPSDAPVCRDGEKVIPCSKGGFSWMSAPTGGCYGAMLDNAPANDPGWAGHDPSEGRLAYCPLDGVSQVMFFVANGAAPQIVDAAGVAQRMLARAPFEVADVQMAPPYGSKTYIRVENWFWIPREQWHNVSVSEDAGPASVTLIAVPSRLVIDTGNNPPAPTSCPDAGRPWRDGMSNAAQTTCSYSYEAIRNPSGDTYNVSGRLEYEVSWTCAGLCSAPAGDLGEYPAPEGEQHPVEVRQRQTVVTQ